MNKLNEEHERHIGRVEVSFYISARDLDPDELTKKLQIAPDSQAKRGDEQKNYVGKVVSTHEEGYWMITSKGRIDSKNINDHFEVLFRLLHPIRHLFGCYISELQGETYFDVLWESSYLYAGTGPVLSATVIKKSGDVRASIGFDIYQLNE